MVCEPDNSQMLASGIPQVRNTDGSTELHPNFRPHLMQGWTPNFIPRLAEEVTDAANIDGFLPINGNHAMQCAIDLAQKEGIFVGTSSGATFAGALAIAEKAEAGSNILCMLPDTGERYLSTPLFDGVSADMNEAEMGISQSTEGFRFDVTATETDEPVDDSTEQAAREVVVLDKKAEREVDQLLTDNAGKVVMFSLEWCEFCWSVRKMMTACDIPYTTIDLDSVAYQDNDRGAKILDVLKARNDWETTPQIFVGDEFVGGATDFFDVGKAGDLEVKLDNQNIVYNQTIKRDPYSFLPDWLHPR